MEDQSNKPHRPTKVKNNTNDKSGPNPKAFAVAHGFKSKRQAARTHDIKEKRLHVPLVDRLPEEAPPIVVTVVGPPGVGKTTLIKSLIKRYTKQTVSTPVGPLTVVTSKRRRLTFLECPSDSLASMLDVAKIADIVLLMIDGNFGFEMETMEFLNALSVSGMPGNVFGILTHLDLFKRQSSLQAAKKRLKHRFWGELYQGAKLFYFSGVINGRYPDREVHNLSRFLSVMKNPRPIIWRNSHPYCLADRFLDITHPTTIEQNPKCDRTIALYGYLRGTNFPAQGARVHVPGVGDLNVSTIEGLPDPCPTPFMEKESERISGKRGKARRLGEKQKLLFAPMADVGGVLVDKDAVYIDVRTSTFSKNEEGSDGDESSDEDRGLGEKLAIRLQGEKKLLGESDSGVQLFRGGGKINSVGGEENNNGENGQEASDDTGRSERRQARFLEVDEGEDGGVKIDHDRTQDNSSDDEEEDDGSDYDETALSLPQHDDFAKRFRDLVNRPEGAEDEEDIGGDSDSAAEDDTQDEGASFFKKTHAEEEELDDRMAPGFDIQRLEQKWADRGNVQALKSRFTLSKPSKKGSDDEDVTDEEDDDDEDEDGDDDDDDVSDLEDMSGDEDEGDGAFEDLETGESIGDNKKDNGRSDADKANGKSQEEGPEDLEAEREKNAKRKEELRLRFEEEDREGFANAKEGERDEEQFGEDDWYDAQKAKLQKQQDINRAEFESLDDASRIRAEGYRAGTYARIVLQNVPYEFANNFNPRYPVIIGGLAPTEERFGFVQVRIKRHRWFKKVLKTNDPLIFSLGWRRFQSTPVYSIDDSRTRNRMLKYTPEHMHCWGTFYGPLVAPNTGFVCTQSFENKVPGFRIAATGVVLNVDENTTIVKKLKLRGYPTKIFRNTAFIRGMFNSALEIAKFEGASVRTVSGVRGQIKRALSKPEGHFRATFEDKILMSDIVFLRSWVPVHPHKFYNPMTDLLDNGAGRNGQGGWQRMRLTGEVRRDEGIPTPLQKDSQYKPVERATRHFNPLRVPRQLAADLPFKSQIVRMRPQKRETYMQRRAVVEGGEEKKARDLMQKLQTLHNEKEAKRAAAQAERRKAHRAKVEEGLEKKSEREKRERNEYWRREGRKRKNNDDDGGGGGSSKGKRKKD